MPPQIIVPNHLLVEIARLCENVLKDVIVKDRIGVCVERHCLLVVLVVRVKVKGRHLLQYIE